MPRGPSSESFARCLLALVCSAAIGCNGCGSGSPAAGNDAGSNIDAGNGDAGSNIDAGNSDAGSNMDAGNSDAGVDDISAMIEPFRADAGMPAITAAVFRGNTMIALGASGVRKQGDATKVTRSDEWHLGSDTKAMTATLIGIAIDQGKLHFSDTIGALFPGMTVDPGYQNVTLEQLLEHRGGAPGDMPADIWSKMWADGSSPTARSTAVASLLSRPPAQAPGTFVYANAGYMIAGRALEITLGDTWEHIIVNNLWGPLGMSSCGFGAPGTPGMVDQPWGHLTNSDGSLLPFDPGTIGSDNPPSLGPAGTAHCALADWGKFLAIHLAGERNEPISLLSDATIQRLHTPPPGGDYAAGWGVTSRSWAGGLALTHSGSNTLWFVTAWLAPAKNIALMVGSNCATGAAQTDIDAAFGPLIGKYIP